MLPLDSFDIDEEFNRKEENPSIVLAKAIYNEKKWKKYKFNKIG